MGGPALMSRIFPPAEEPEERSQKFPVELPEATLKKLDLLVAHQADVRGKKRLSRSWVLQWIVEWAYDEESKSPEMKKWLSKRDKEER